MQERGEDTREKILSVALKLFSERGFDATGVAEICEQAGLSKGAFYHHFPTKQAVFLNMVDTFLKGLDQDLLSMPEGSMTTVPELLRHMARRTEEIFSLANGRLSIFLEFWAQARKEPEVWSRTVEPFRRYREMFATLIRKGIHEGTLRKVDPDAAGSALVSLAVGVVLQGVVDNQGAKWHEVMMSSVELLLSGMEI